MKRGMMARREDEGYDWLNDPFDDSKNPEDQFKMTQDSKRLVAIAFALAIVVLFAVVGLVFLSLFSMLSG